MDHFFSGSGLGAYNIQNQILKEMIKKITKRTFRLLGMLLIFIQLLLK